MDVRPTTPQQRIALLNPWRMSFPDEEERTETRPGARDTLVLQRMPAVEKAEDAALGYGCVDWYLYPKFARGADEPPTH